MLDRVVVQQVGRGLADALPQALGGLFEFPRFHLRGDALGLLQGGLARLHREDRFERVAGPSGVPRADPGQHVTHEGTAGNGPPAAAHRLCVTVSSCA